MDNKNIQRTMSDESNTYRVDKCQVSLDDLLALKVYRLQVGPHFYDGVVAQDVENIMPQAVSMVNGKKIVDYNMIVGPLVNAFQEYVTQTEDRINNLEMNMQAALSIVSDLTVRGRGKTKSNMGTNEAKWEG